VESILAVWVGAAGEAGAITSGGRAGNGVGATTGGVGSMVATCVGALDDAEQVSRSIREVAARMPSYITLKDVKRRWGKGQEDVFPVAQFEKLFVDMTALPEIACKYAVVSRRRGQQLKEPAQLDSWVRDGSAEFVESLTQF